MGPAGGNTVGRLGVFGGSFDPPHAAHMAMAQAAMTQLHLDRLLIVPTGQAYHKARALSDTTHRLAMCEAVWGDTPGVQIDPRETQRERPSYTVETLTELRAQWPGAQIFLLMGADQWSAFTTWKDWRRILDMSTVVVATRPGQPGVSDELPCVHLSMSALPWSSTELRAAAAGGHFDATDPSNSPLHPAVASYISQHHLYETVQ
jgi:nicotinate-nucleotide adenylyltransferase